MAIPLIPTAIVNPTYVYYNAKGQGALLPFRVLMLYDPKYTQLLYPNLNVLDLAGFRSLRKDKVNLDVTQFITGMTWEAGDDQKYVSFTLTMDNFKGLFNMVPLGTRFILQIRRPFYTANWTNPGKYYTYMITYLFEKERSSDGDKAEMRFSLYDRAYWLSKQKVHKVFKADSRHPRGWTASEMVREIAKEVKIPVGTIANTTKRFKRFEVKTDAAEAINKVLKKDKDATTRKYDFDVNMRDGKLNVKQKYRPKAAYLITDDNLIESGTLTETLKEDFATKLILNANDKRTKRNNKRRRVKGTTKQRVEVSDPYLIPLLGIIEKTETSKGHSSPGELQVEAKKKLEELTTPKREFSFTMRGIPDLWPGSRIFLVSRYFGMRGLLEIQRLEYTVSGKEFTMNVHVKMDNVLLLPATQVRLLYKAERERY